MTWPTLPCEGSLFSGHLFVELLLDQQVGFLCVGALAKHLCGVYRHERKKNEKKKYERGRERKIEKNRERKREKRRERDRIREKERKVEKVIER